MKKKIMKRNKKKYTQLLKISKKLDCDLKDTIALYAVMAHKKQEDRVINRSETILDFDNAKEFLAGKYLVPIKYKLPSGKVKNFGGKRMFKNEEAMEKCQYESNSGRNSF